MFSYFNLITIIVMGSGPRTCRIRRRELKIINLDHFICFTVPDTVLSLSLAIIKFTVDETFLINTELFDRQDKLYLFLL